MNEQSTTILCLSSYHKGQEFLRAAAASGARTFLLTVESLRRRLAARRPGGPATHAFFDPPMHMRHAASWLARTEPLGIAFGHDCGAFGAILDPPLFDRHIRHVTRETDAFRWITHRRQRFPFCIEPRDGHPRDRRAAR